MFQSGHALFMRNWPYAWALGQKCGEHREVTGSASRRFPPEGPQDTPHAVLGGQLLAVSAYSANRELAIDLVMYLTGREEQKRRALAGSLNPTIPALFDDADIRRDAPFIAQLRPIFTNRRWPAPRPWPGRPATTRFRRASSTRFTGCSPAHSTRRRRWSGSPRHCVAKGASGLGAVSGGATSARRGGLAGSRARAAWMLAAPALIVLAAIAGWPLARTIWFSFTDAELSDFSHYAFVGFANYLGRFEGEWDGVLPSQIRSGGVHCWNTPVVRPDIGLV